jgi:hypothetical protein
LRFVATLLFAEQAGKHRLAVALLSFLFSEEMAHVIAPLNLVAVLVAVVLCARTTGAHATSAMINTITQPTADRFILFFMMAQSSAQVLDEKRSNRDKTYIVR